MTARFNPPTSTLPEWIKVGRQTIEITDGEEFVELFVPEARTLLRVLLEVVPDADRIVREEQTYAEIAER